jgi:predicted ATPase
LTMPMYLRTLGGLSLENSSFRRPKPLLLLAYLALEGAKPRRYLGELFFMDAADQMNSLSRALSYLRQEVPDVIDADNKKVWATVSCDAAELLSLTDTKQFEKCLELYKGAFAVDYDLELSEELEEWLYGTREILAAKARQAFLTLGEQEASKGNFSQAAHLAEKAYRLREAKELEPDDFARLHNLLYAGNSPLAAEVRQEAESFEIPLELSREEAKAQLSETVETAHDIPNNLPPPKTSFIGRDQELIEIAQQLAKKDCRLLTLHGMGGIGKSRLAIQAAYDQLRATRGFSPLFKDGVYFVTLDALTSAELIPSSIAEALSLELQGQEDTLSQVKRFIGRKHVLLLLDNYEHLMAGATLTSRLLEACPNLKLLVTSRERLNVEEEWVLTLDGLAVPSTTQLSEAERFDALNLFVQRSKRAMLEFSLTQENLPHALKICQLVEGSPLGIELAAVWVKTLPVAEIAKEIESNLNILETPTKNIAERHQSIRAAFEHSWKLLTDREQEVLRKLSVFVGGFRREAAAEVAGATLPLLAGLVDKSLLRVSENGRYDRHLSILEFTKSKLSEFDKEDKNTRKRLTFYICNFLENQLRLISMETQKQVFRAIDEDMNNIITALQFSLEMMEVSKFLTIMQLLVVKTQYFDARGYSTTFLEYLKKAIAIAKTLENFEAAHYLSTKLGNTYRELIGDFEQAEKAYSDALKLAEVINNTHRQIILLSLLGVIYAQKESVISSNYFDRAEFLAEQNQDFLALSHVLQNKSHVAALAGNYDKLHFLSKEAIDVVRKLKTVSNVNQLDVDANLFFSLLNLSDAKRLLNQEEAAISTIIEALKIAEVQDNKLWIAYALQQKGEIYQFFRKHEKAQENYNQALGLYQQHNALSEILKLREMIDQINLQL